MRKHKGFHLPYEVLGEMGGKPTNCGRKDLERSSMCWKNDEKSNKIRETNGEIISKSYCKVWNRVFACMRHKKVKVIKYFQDECQWKWQYDEIEDVLCIKINEKEHEEQKQDYSNLRKKVHVCTGKTNNLSMQCYGVLGTFSKGELRVVGNNKDFLIIEPVESIGRRLSEEVM